MRICLGQRFATELEGTTRLTCRCLDRTHEHERLGVRTRIGGLGRRLFREHARPLNVARSQTQRRRDDRPTVPAGAIVRRSELASELAQLRRHVRDSACVRARRGLVERRGEGRIRAPSGEREMPRSLERIENDPSESGVRRTPRRLVRSLIDGRSEERVREPDPAHGLDDDPVRERRLEPVLGARQSQRLRLCLSERGEEHECRTRRLWQGVEPGAKEAVECLRHRQWCAGLDVVGECPCELEGVEGIPARGLVDAE